MSLLGGYPSPRQWGTPVLGGGYPSPGWDTPQSGQDGIPPSQDRMGYPPPRGTPWPGWGTPIQTGYTWTGYASGGTPLAVSRRRTALFKINIFQKIGISAVDNARLSI